MSKLKCPLSGEISLPYFDHHLSNADEFFAASFAEYLDVKFRSVAPDNFEQSERIQLMDRLFSGDEIDEKAIRIAAHQGGVSTRVSGGMDGLSPKINGGLLLGNFGGSEGYGAALIGSYSERLVNIEVGFVQSHSDENVFENQIMLGAEKLFARDDWNYFLHMNIVGRKYTNVEGVYYLFGMGVKLFGPSINDDIPVRVTVDIGLGLDL